MKMKFLRGAMIRTEQAQTGTMVTAAMELVTMAADTHAKLTGTGTAP